MYIVVSMRRLFCIGALFMLGSIVSGQRLVPHFTQYTSQDGLASSAVYDVFQDSKGFMWFCTDAGVSRYDGQRFENFNQKDGLAGLATFEAFEDHRGRIWFVPHNCRLSYFDYADNQIHQYPYNDLINESGKEYPMQDFAVAKDGTVHFAAMRKGKMSVDTLGIIRYKEKCEVVDFKIEEVDDRLFIWECLTKPGFPSPTRLAVDIEGLNVEFEMLDHMNPYQGSYNPDVIRFREAIAVNLGTQMFIIEERKIKKVDAWETPNTFVSKSNRYFWTGSYGGGFRSYEKKEDKWELVHHFFDGFAATDFLQDDEGGFWFSTAGNGVFYTPTIDVQIVTDGNGRSLENSHFVTGNGVDEVLMGSKEGKLFRLNTRSGEVDEILIPADVFGGKKYKFLQSGAYSNRERAYWLGEYELWKLDEEGRWEGGFPKNRDEFMVHKDLDVIGDALFSMNHVGFSKIKEGNEKLVSAKVFGKEIRCNSILPVQGGQYYIGTDQGLLLAKDSNLIFLEDSISILGANITSLCQWRNSLVVGTKGNGII